MFMLPSFYSEKMLVLPSYCPLKRCWCCRITVHLKELHCATERCSTGSRPRRVDGVLRPNFPTKVLTNEDFRCHVSQMFDVQKFTSHFELMEATHQSWRGNRVGIEWESSGNCVGIELELCVGSRSVRCVAAVAQARYPKDASQMCSRCARDAQVRDVRDGSCRVTKQGGEQQECVSQT